MTHQFILILSLLLHSTVPSIFISAQQQRLLQLDAVEENNGYCASTFSNAILDCNKRKMCSGDVDCVEGGDQCYLNTGCGNALMELTSEFLITIIGIETTMDEVATATFSEAMTTVLSPILEELNIALDSVTVTDQQNLGTILDVNVRFSGFYRPPIEQSLGGVIIDAFDTEMQNSFISTLNNQGGEYFSGVQEGGVILALIEDDSTPASLPTMAPSGSIQIETLPSDTTPPQTSSSVEEEPISTPQLPTQSPTTSPPPTIAPRELQGPFYLAVLIQNTPYQSKYMDEADFTKFAQVLTSVLNEKLGDALTIEDVTLGYQQLIQVGSGTATEVNLSYEVASNLASSQIESMVSRAVGRNRKEIIALLQDDWDFYPYFLEIGEIQAQSITQFGDPTSTATLPDNIPVKPTPSPTPLPPPEEEVVDKEPEAGQNQGEEDSNAQVAEPEWTGPTAAELLAEDEAKKNQAGLAPTAVEPIVTNEPGGSNGGVIAGVVIGILVVFIAVGLSYRHVKRKRAMVDEEREVDEDEIADDLENGHKHSSRQLKRERTMKKVNQMKRALSKSFGSSEDLEGVDTGVPLGTDDDLRGRKSKKSGAKPTKRKGDDDSSSSGDSSSSSSSSSDDDSSSDDSSSDESEDLKAARSKKSQKKSSKQKDDEAKRRNKKHHREESATADSLAAIALSAPKQKRDRPSKGQEAVDEKRAKELKACMNDRSLSRDERKHKMDEIRARYSSKNSQDTAKSERFQSSLENIEEGKRSKSKKNSKMHESDSKLLDSDRPPMPPGKSKRRTVDGSHRDAGHSSGKSRRNLDNESSRRLADESAGRESKDRRKSKTKSSKESHSSESSEDRLLSSDRSSKRGGKHSSEKSRHRTSDRHREEKNRERRSNGSSPQKHEARKSSGKSKRRTESPQDEEGRLEEPLSERRHSRKKDGDNGRSDRDKHGDRRKSSSKKHDSHDEKHSKRRRKPQ